MSKAIYLDSKEELEGCSGNDKLIILCNPFLHRLAIKHSQNAIDLFEFWSQNEMNVFSLECWRLSEQIIEIAKGQLAKEKDESFSFIASQDNSLYRFLHSYLFFQISFRRLLDTIKISSIEFKNHEDTEDELNIFSVPNLNPPVSRLILPLLKQVKIKIQTNDIQHKHINSELNSTPDKLLSRLLVNGLTVSLSTVLLRRLKSFGVRGKTILIGGLNEKINEELIGLLTSKKHLRLIDIKSLQKQLNVLPIIEEKFSRKFHIDLKSKINWKQYSFISSSLNSDLCDYALETTSLALDRMFNHLIAAKTKSHEYLVKQFATENAPSAVITNGLMGLVGEQIYSNLKSMGCSVYCFEHGVTVGLARCNHERGKSLEAVNADHFFVCSEAAKEENCKQVVKGHDWCHVVGPPKQVIRPNLPKLQRYLARKKLSIKNKEKVLMHIWGYYYFGNAPFLFQQLPQAQLNLENELNREVYPLSPYRVFVKEYPSRRFFYQTPMQERYQDLVVNKNLEFLGYEDFRYIRMAGDVFVTHCPTSTLGWVLGADKPTIFLGSDVIKPLINNIVKQHLSEALFYIDTDTRNWRKNLDELLQMPYYNLISDWEMKAKARREFLHHYLGKNRLGSDVFK